MAKVDDATTAVGSSQSWFKIGEMGLPSNNPDYWGTEVLNDNCGHYTFTVPEGIAPGNYLIRAEVIGGWNVPPSILTEPKSNDNLEL